MRTASGVATDLPELWLRDSQSPGLLASRPLGLQDLTSTPFYLWLYLLIKVTLKKGSSSVCPSSFPNILTHKLSFLQSGGVSPCPLSEKSTAQGLLPQVWVHVWQPDSRPLENSWCIFLFRSPHWTRVCGHPGRIQMFSNTRQYATRIYLLFVMSNTVYEYEKRNVHLAIQFKKSNW